MDFIIQAILRIFEAVFEKDASRRRQGPETEKPAPPPAKRRRTLEEWLADNLQELESQMQPQPRPVPPRRVAPQPLAPQPVDHRQAQILEESAPTPAPHETERPMWAALGETYQKPMAKRRAQKIKPVRRFRLPGKTGLEKMIYAQTILGPCRALQENADRF